MRTLKNQLKGLALAGLVAAALVNASPAFAGQAVTVNKNGSKMCLMLDGVEAFVPEVAAAAIGAILEAFGC